MLRTSCLLRRSLCSNLSSNLSITNTVPTTHSKRRIMSSSTTLTASPFTRAVVNAMRALYPEALADKSFDNTGLLLESPLQPLTAATTSPTPRLRNSVLLTIDLTRAVATEALARRASVVVAYHPIIFRPLKSLTLADTQQQSLLQLAAAGVSVYSPHTAVDAAPGGLGDWLADIVTGTPIGGGNGGEVGGTAKWESEQQTKRPDKATTATKARPAAPGRTYSSPAYPQVHATTESTGASGTSSNPPTREAIPHTRRVIIPSPSPPSTSTSNDTTTANEAGMGRLITFTTPQPLGSLIDRIARGVGSPKGFAVAVPQSTDGRSGGIEGITIRKVAVCAGSGEGVFRHAEEADLYFTGELSHHAALAVTERGGCVVSLFHSNSERGFLHQVLRPRLEERVRAEWERVRSEERGKKEEGVGEAEEEGEGGRGMVWDEILADESVAVEVSERDRDPYGIVVLQEE